MKNRIDKSFEELRRNGGKALITFITAGDPDLEATVRLVSTMEKAGADIVELGIPYSDPLADGPVIQKASKRALDSGTTIAKIFEAVDRIREASAIPLAFLAYYNSIYRYGVEGFIEKCCQCGVDGLIIPDLPLEERQEMLAMLEDKPLRLIPLVAPTSADRIKNIVNNAGGFIYCISSKGVTGVRSSFETNLEAFIGEVRKHTGVPCALGFGISDRKTIRELEGLADGFIVGSAIVQKIEEGIAGGDIEERVYEFVKSLKADA